MNGAVPGSVYKPGMQPLDRIRLIVSLVSGGGIGLVALTGWRNHLKRKKEREEA